MGSIPIARSRIAVFAVGLAGFPSPKYALKSAALWTQLDAPRSSIAHWDADYRTKCGRNHFGELLLNESDTSENGLPSTSFLWLSQTNLEARLFTHITRYFAGFWHS